MRRPSEGAAHFVLALRELATFSRFALPALARLSVSPAAAATLKITQRPRNIALLKVLHRPLLAPSRTRSPHSLARQIGNPSGGAVQFTMVIALTFNIGQ